MFVGDKMKHINYQGKSIDAEEIDVLTSNEKWNEYQLADGAELATKTVLIRVFKAIAEKTPDGEPLYIINSNSFVKVKNTN
jgi:hypothetical protein